MVAPHGYPHTFTVVSLAASATQGLTQESIDHLAGIGAPCNTLIVKNESGVPCAVYINGDTDKNLVVPSGKTEAWDREFEFTSVVVKNIHATDAMNTDGVHVTFARLTPLPHTVVGGMEQPRRSR